MAKKELVPEQKVALSRKKIGGETPMVVSQLTEQCIYSGFFGSLDSARMKAITEKILDLLDKSGMPMIIVDLSNVDLVDSAVAAHLMRFGNVMKMVGVEMIFCGIKPVIAQTMVVAGSEVSGFRVSKDLKSALKEVLVRQGLMLVPIGASEHTVKELTAQLQQQQQQQQQQQ